MTLHAETAYLFRHAVMRDAAYQLQPPEDRAVLHAVALELLLDIVPDNERDAFSVELADHALCAQAAPGADVARLQRIELDCLRQGAAHEAAAWRNRQAVTLMLRCTDHPLAAGAERFDWLMEAAGILMRSGGLADCPALLDRAEAHVGDDPRRRAQLLASRAQHAGMTSRYPEAAAWCEQAMEGTATDARLMAGILNSAAQVAIAQGDHQRCKDLARRCLDLCRETSLPTAESRAHLYYGDACWQCGELDQAADHFQAAVTVLEAADQPGHLASALDHLGSLQLYRERVDEAETLHTRARALYEKVGDGVGVGVTIANLANVRMTLGDPEHAFALQQQALHSFRSAGVAQLEAVALGNLGNLGRALGRMGEADACFEAARDIFRRIGRPIELAVFTSHHGQLRLLLGDTESARALITESYAALDANEAASWRDKYPGVALLRLAVQGALDSGDLSEFREVAARITALDAAARLGVDALVNEVESAVSQGRPALVFRGFCVGDIPPPARLALLDAMRRNQPEEFAALKANTALAKAMAQDTENPTVPDGKRATG